MFTDNFIKVVNEVASKMVDESAALRTAANDKEGRKQIVTKPQIMRAVAEKIGDTKLGSFSDLLLSQTFTILLEGEYITGFVCIQGPYGGVQRYSAEAEAKKAARNSKKAAKSE